jgi:hypothetical protein
VSVLPFPRRTREGAAPSRWAVRVFLEALNGDQRDVTSGQFDTETDARVGRCRVGAAAHYARRAARRPGLPLLRRHRVRTRPRTPTRIPVQRLGTGRMGRASRVSTSSSALPSAPRRHRGI